MEKNNDVKELIKAIIDDEESSKENLISVREILLAERRRHEEKNVAIFDKVKSLKSHFPYLSDVIFYKNICSMDKNSIMIWLKFVGYQNIRYAEDVNHIMLDYRNGALNILNPIGVRDEIKKLILVTDRNLYIELAKYGIKNNFHVDPIIKTASNHFKLHIFDNEFSINLISEGKTFKLYHSYIMDSAGKNLPTRYGRFNLVTDILGVDNLFANKKFAKLENRTESFISHLKVDERDIPNYLK